MNKTDNYAIPYPECDPPLIKDSSQIAQFKAQAMAVDTAMTAVEAQAADQLTNPPSARGTIAVLPVVTTDSQVTVDITQNVFTSTSWGAAVAVTSGGLLIQKPGWYLAGCHALVSSATAAVLPMVRLTVNGSPASSWSTPAGNYGVGNGRLAALSAVPLLVAAEDTIRMEIKHLATGSPSWDYRPHLWAVRMLEPS